MLSANGFLTGLVPEDFTVIIISQIPFIKAFAKDQSATFSGHVTFLKLADKHSWKRKFD